jgi:hypothetical protein
MDGVAAQCEDGNGGASDGACGDHVDYLFALDGPGLQIANLPQNSPRVTVRRRREKAGLDMGLDTGLDIGLDFGAWSDALTAVRDLDVYTHYCFMNSTARGPFFPMWTERDVRVSWWRVFVGRLSEDVSLVGATIGMREDPERPCTPALPYVQSPVFVTNRAGLGVALRNGVFAPLSVRESKDWDDRGRAVAWSQHILDAGLNIACMLAAHSDVDFRRVRHNVALGRRFAAQGRAGDPLCVGGYFGATVHPCECVFFRTDRGMTPELLEEVTRLVDKQERAPRATPTPTTISRPAMSKPPTPTLQKSRRKKPRAPTAAPTTERDGTEGASGPTGLQASYGADSGRYVDVTTLLKSVLDTLADAQGRLSLDHLPPATFGVDPCPGVQKRLCVSYINNKARGRRRELWEYAGRWVDPPRFLFSDEDDVSADERKGPTRRRSTLGDAKTEVRERKERHPLNAFCQKVFVINLARATERRKRFAEECRAQGLEVEWVQAIDGHLERIAYPANPRHGKYWNAGAAALCQTVLRLLQTVMLDPSVQQVAMFEDDVYFVPGARALLATVLPTVKPPLHWELLYLGHTHIGPAPLPVTAHTHLRRMQHQGGLAAHAYCVHRSVIPRLISELERARDPLDVIYADLIFKRGKSFTVSPLVAYTGDTHSWILQEATPRNKPFV